MMFREKFSKHLFILGLSYSQKRRVKCQLFNFVFGQAKIAIYLGRRNKIEEFDINTVFVRMVKARLKVDFDFFSTTSNVEEFINIWCLKNVLCSVVENVLCFGTVLS